MVKKQQSERALRFLSRINVDSHSELSGKRTFVSCVDPFISQCVTTGSPIVVPEQK